MMCDIFWRERCRVLLSCILGWPGYEHQAQLTRGKQMNLLRDLPIQRKMLVMTLLICGAVLIVAIVGLFTFQVLNFQSNFQRDAVTLAAVVANQSTAAIEFKDRDAATEVVTALEAKPSVVAATLALADGLVIAHFGKTEDQNTDRKS